jgi:hypothetical protein
MLKNLPIQFWVRHVLLCLLDFNSEDTTIPFTCEKTVV